MMDKAQVVKMAKAASLGNSPEAPRTRQVGRYPKKINEPTRRLLLVDIENVCGTGILASNDVAKARNEILWKFNLSEDDLVVTGVSHSKNNFVCGLEWKGPRRVFAKGRNGDEHALIESLGCYRLNTFSSVVLISGDGIFTEVAKKIRAQEQLVVVAAQARRLNERLAAVASSVCYMNESVPAIA